MQCGVCIIHCGSLQSPQQVFVVQSGIQVRHTVLHLVAFGLCVSATMHSFELQWDDLSRCCHHGMQRWLQSLSVFALDQDNPQQGWDNCMDILVTSRLLVKRCPQTMSQPFTEASP